MFRQSVIDDELSFLSVRIRTHRIRGFSGLKNCSQCQAFILLNSDYPVNPDSDNPCDFINKLDLLHFQLFLIPNSGFVEHPTAVYRQCAVCYMDFWEAYKKMFPRKRHKAREKGLINHIERFNNTLRQRAGATR